MLINFFNIFIFKFLKLQCTFNIILYYFQASFILIRGSRSNHNGWTNYYSPRMHWKSPRSGVKMRSARIFNKVGLAQSVDALLLRTHLLLEMVSPLALFSGPDTVQLQEPPVTNLLGWLDTRHGVQEQPGTWRCHPKCKFVEFFSASFIIKCQTPQDCPCLAAAKHSVLPVFLIPFRASLSQTLCLSLCLPVYSSSERHLSIEMHGIQAVLHWDAFFDKIVYYRDVSSNMAPKLLQTLKYRDAQLPRYIGQDIFKYIKTYVLNGLSSSH